MAMIGLPGNDPHTLRSFDDALNALTAGFVAMGEHTCEMLNEAGRAMLDGDPAIARAVVEADMEVDRQFEALRSQALEVITRFTPVASDLRRVIAVEHAVGDLERIADHAKNSAKRVISNPVAALDPKGQPIFSRFHAQVLGAVEDVVDAFGRVDVDLARTIIRGDRAIDEMHDDFFNAVVADLRTGTSDRALTNVHLLFVAKNLERVGDHATNIAEEILFMARGEPAPATRK
jgi:phosphate transport system protein